jgi:hypothetical protein
MISPTEDASVLRALLTGSVLKLPIKTHSQLLLYIRKEMIPSEQTIIKRFEMPINISDKARNLG